jgi:ribosome biogenesis protein BRX1
VTFSILDGKIWIRNYQILGEGGEEEMRLVEIGPRFVLTVIRIFEGSFGGVSVYSNGGFIRPGWIRKSAKREKGERYNKRKEAEEKSKRRRNDLKRKEDALVFF